MKNRRINKRNQAGVTLVALVITIIVLLTLAGVTIAALTGENGIINRAYEAKEATELAQIKEEVLMKWYEIENDHLKDYLPNAELADLLEQELQKVDPNATVKYSSANETLEIFYKGYEIEIQADGQVSNKRETAKNNIINAYSNAKNNSSDKQTQAAKIQEELRKTDPNATATYNSSTGNIDINYNGYKESVNDNGEVVISEPVETAKLTITSQPKTVETYEKEEVNFEVGIDTNGEATYQWYVNTKNVTTGATAIEGATSNKYTIPSVSLNENGTYYYCEITSSLNNTTKTARTNIVKLTVLMSTETKSENSVTDVWAEIKDDDSLSNQEKAEKLEQELQKTDPNAEVKYNEETGDFEVKYNDHEQIIDDQGNSKSAESKTEAENNITDAWSDIKDDDTKTPQEKAAALEEELKKTDENATVTYDPLTGDYEVNYNGYKETLDSEGNAKTADSKTIAENNITDAWSDIKDDDTKTPQEKAAALEEELKKTDENATVTYDEETGKYEITYRGYEETIDSEGNAKSSESQNITETNITDAWAAIKNNDTLTPAQKAAALQEELRKTDPTATVTYNEMTGDIEVTYNGYKQIIDQTGTSKSEEAKTIAENNITEAWASINENEETKDKTPAEKAAALEEELKKTDENATVTYDEETGKYEITYRGYNETIDSEGNAKSSESQNITETNITDAWADIKNNDTLTNQQKAEALQEELRKTDPTATVTYNEMTGDIEVTYNGYKQIIDQTGTSKSEESKTIAENNITDAWSDIKNDDTKTPAQKAEALETELKKTDENAKVTYDETTGKYEITYRGYEETIDSTGTAKSSESQNITENNITEAWSDIKDDDSLSEQEKAEKLEEELKKTDEDAKVNYNEETGDYEVDYNGYKQIIDGTGKSKSEESKTIAENNITDAWADIKNDDTKTPEQKAQALEEELKKTDENATVTYDPLTGDYEVNYNGYKETLDSEGNAKTADSKTIAESNITNAWSEIKDNDSLTPEQKAAELETELKKTDSDAKVTYDETTGKYEITYRGYEETIDSNGNAKSSESQNIAENNITEAWSDIKDDDTKTPEQKAKELEEELKKTDEDAKVNYNEETGDIEVSYNGYNQIIDDTGKSKSEESKTIAENNITDAWSNIKDDDTKTPEQKAQALETELKKTDDDATVTYDPLTGDYEINYNGYKETVDSNGTAKPADSKTIAENNITDAWSDIKDDDTKTPEEKAQALETELKKTDENATVTYNSETDTMEITYRGYEETVDSNGNAKSLESKTIAEENISGEWSDITDDNTMTPEQKAAKLEDELQKTDPSATVTYNQEDQTMEVTYNGYKETISRDDIIKTPQITVVPSAKSGNVDYNSTNTFTVTPTSSPAINGTLEVSSNRTDYVSIEEGNNATATDSQATTIKYKGLKATTEATTITVTFTPSDTANYDTVSTEYTVTSVNKINATNPGITDYTGKYDGAEHRITVDPTTVETLGGTIQYSTDEGENKNWSTTNPGRTDYGTTTVYVRVEGDSNHNSTEPTSGLVTITSADIEYTASDYSGTYDGASHGITVDVTKPTGATIYYSETVALTATLQNNNTWQVSGGSSTNPEKTDVTTNEPNGKVTVYWIIVPANGNYAPWSGSNTIEITQKDIKGADITASLNTTSYTYDGTAKEPTATITDTEITGSPTLVAGTDYTISYSEDHTNVGTPVATITGQGNYKGSTEKPYTITRAKTATASGDTTLIYNGDSQDGVSGTDVEWSTSKGDTSATDAGTYKAYATPDSNHAWSDGTVAEKEITWKINPKEVSTTWGDVATFTYNGTEQAPTASAESGITGETLTITRTTKKDAGTYTGTNASTASISVVTGGQAKTENYTLTNTTKDFTINAKSITVTWTDPAAGYTYNGSAQGPEITSNSGVTGETINVTLKYKVKDAADSTYTTTKPSDAATYTAKITDWTVTGGQARAANYDLTPQTHDYTIARAQTSTATASGGEHTYTGSTITALSGNYISWRGDTSGIDVKYVDNDPTKAVANYVAYATPLANYAWDDGSVDEKEITWKILPKTISTAEVTLETTSYTYDGTSKTPGVTVEDSTTLKADKTLVKDTDYTVTYPTDTTNYGTKIVTITGKGNYKDTNKTGTYAITQVKPTVELSPTTASIDYDETKTFTATASSSPSVNGKFEITSGDSTKVEIVSGDATNTTSTTVEYKGKAATTNSTTISVKFTPTDTTNYETITESFTVSAVNKIDSVAPVLEDTSNAYNGTARTVNTKSQGSGGTLYYRGSTDGGNNYGAWQTTAPTITNVSDATNGVLYVQAYIAGDDNHNDSEIQTAKATITSAGIEYTASNYNAAYDGQAHSISVNVTSPSGTTVYYSTSASLNATLNGNSWQPTGGSTTNPTATTVAQSTTVNWVIVPANSNYAPVTGSNTITITRKDISGTTITLSQDSFTYDGTAKEPTVTVTDTDRNVDLTGNGTDYSVSYSQDHTNVGTPSVTITGTVNYTGTNSKDYTITRDKTATASGDTTTLIYNGDSQNGTSGSNVTWSTTKGTRSEKDAGTYKAYATPDSNHAWSDGTVAEKEITWKISPKEVSTTWGDVATFEYNGTDQAPTASATSGVANETINVTRTTKKDAGTYNTAGTKSTASISSVTGGQGKAANYLLTNTTKDFTITAKSITVTWTDPDDGYTYNGSGQGPATSYNSGVTGETINVTVKYKVKNADDSTYTTTKPSNSATYTAKITDWTVTGGQARAANYDLTPKTHDYTIARQKTSTATASGGEHTYTGSLITALSGDHITWRGDTSGTNVKYVDNDPTKAIANYTAYATPVANYAWSDGGTDEREITWKITPKSVTANDITVSLNTTTFTYDGNTKTPTVTVKDGIRNTNLTSGTDYTVTYSYDGGTTTTTEPKTAGTVTVIVTGKGNYTGTNKTKSYAIKQADGSGTVTLAGWTYGQTANDPVPSSSTNGTSNVSYTYYTNSALTTKTTTANGASSEGAKPSNAGTYWVQATFAATTNYKEVKASNTFTIEQADGSGTVTMAGWTYGQTATNPQPSSSTNGTSNVSYTYYTNSALTTKTTTANGASSEGAKPSNAGTYWVQATFAATTNYKEVKASNTFTISQATVTLSNIPTTLQYVGKDSEKTFTATSSVAGTWSVSSDNTSRINITQGASASNATSNAVKYKGIAAVDADTTITVAFTPTDTTNYATPTSKTFKARATEITATKDGTAVTSVTLYVGGDPETVALGGTNAGSFEVNIAPNDSYAIASITNSTLTITPGTTAGTTSVMVIENIAGATLQINIITQPVPNFISSTTSLGYDTLALAYAATNAGDTINVNRECSDSTTTEISRNIILNLNNYTLSRETYITVRNGGTLRIIRRTEHYRHRTNQ